MNKKWMRGSVLAFLLCFAPVLAVPAESGAASMTIVYSNNIIGQIEPCPT